MVARNHSSVQLSSDKRLFSLSHAAANNDNIFVIVVSTERWLVQSNQDVVEKHPKTSPVDLVSHPAGPRWSVYDTCGTSGEVWLKQGVKMKGNAGVFFVDIPEDCMTEETLEAIEKLQETARAKKKHKADKDAEI
eukprot:210656-Hanusia_phi.AAC.2